MTQMDTLFGLDPPGSGPDVLLVQEHRVPPHKRGDVRWRCEQEGYHIQMTPATTGPGTVRSAGGVAILHKSTVRYQDEPTLFPEWRKAGRVMAGRLHTVNGTFVSYVINVYCHSDPQHHKEQLQQLWSDIDAWIQARFKLPIILAGDFNAELDYHHTASQWIINGGFSDPHLQWEGERQPTHRAGRALDHFVLSEAVQLRCVQANTWGDWPLPTHRPLEITIQQPKPWETLLRTVHQLPVTPKTKNYLKQTYLSTPPDPQLCHYVTHGCVDKAYQRWSELWEARLQEACVQVGMNPQPHHLGRHLPHMFVRARLPEERSNNISQAYLYDFGSYNTQ